MSKKFFSFIHGETVRAAPNSKFIPAEAFSSLMDSIEILNKVKEDALKYRQEVTAESELIKEQAYREGFDQGFQSWHEHIKGLQKEIDNVRNEYAKQLAPVALKATQKIFGKAFEMSDDMIYNIVANTLKAVSQHKRVTIYVNKADQHALEANRDLLKKNFEDLEVLSIREGNDITRGGYVIETEGGIINGRLENLWNVLEKAFESILSPDAINTEKTVSGK